ncbi:hypothetical protein D9M09_11850 [Janthinobacterium agaricidamnosum]|uniref:Uncharacterized protein n=1 Tax=Janthinobacterium agaricidamnosum TaxID=55508 RepID=A0A3G2E903_9BURK|nr:hypothetical protein D9M09_11850 [Janthinobacterium agaricidamnosum]
MTPREIQTLMRKFCYFRVSAADGYHHLIKENVLDVNLVDSLIREYVGTKDVIVYASSHQCALVSCTEAYELICEYRRNDASATVQVVASDFSGRVMVEPIGTGVGEHRKVLF